MYTIDIESVNGGIYRSRETAATLAAARGIIREGLRGLDSYYSAWIADAGTGRRMYRGVRGYRTGWMFVPVTPLTRGELETTLIRTLGYEDAHAALDLADTCGEFRFTRTDDYGPLHWRASRYGDGTYALDKIPA